MIKAYQEGKDLYAVVGSMAFKVPYEECLEFNPITGAIQPEGKARRKKAKTIFLAILYGMGTKTLAERINVSVDEAQDFIDNFYKGFSGVKAFTDKAELDAKKIGYVKDIYGRRRHLPDAALPEYTFTRINVNDWFNPLLNTPSRAEEEAKAFEKKKKDYTLKLRDARSKEDKKVIEAAIKKDGILVRNNGGFISRAARQTLNAMIQGSAATMTKKAMIAIENDDELNRLGFKLLVTVHDEVWGEAPVENAEAAAKRLCEVMVDTAKERCWQVPWKCDPYVTRYWYLDEVSAEVLKAYKKCNDIDKVYEKFPMYSRNIIESMCNETLDLLNIDKLV